jgi:transposase-like protein
MAATHRLKEECGELAPSEDREAAAEIRRLKRELEVVRQERDILKKAIQIFSQDQKR